MTKDNVLDLIKDESIVGKCLHVIDRDGAVSDDFEYVSTLSFDVIGENADQKKHNIVDKIDREFIPLLMRRSSEYNPIAVYHKDVEKNLFEKMQYNVERNRLLVDKFIMNRSELGQMKRNINAIDLDPITSRSGLLSGHFGSLWGVDIYVTVGEDQPTIPQGLVFALTVGRYLGRFKLMSFKDNGMHGASLKVYMDIINSRAISCGAEQNLCNIELKELDNG